MDERRTLSILGMVLGSLLGALFVLEAIALSDTATVEAKRSMPTDLASVEPLLPVAR